MLNRTAAVIMAAGQGTRMKSSLPKVLHKVLGRPLVLFPVSLARTAGVDRVVVVVGHAREAVEAVVRTGDPEARFAVQVQQRGTADAVKAAQDAVGDADEVLILSGDVPALRLETLKRLEAARDGVPLALLAFETDDATGYGRVACQGDRVQRIVEHKDCTPEPRELSLCNAGIYLVNRAFLFDVLSRVNDDNAQGELYLTDIAHLAAEAGQAGRVVTVSEQEVLGVNDRSQLAEIGARIRHERNLALMKSGVTMHDPQRTWVEMDVEVAPDVELHADVTLRGRTTIGRGTEIRQGAVLEDATVGEDVLVKPYCVVSESRLDNGVAVGPFAHLRPGTVLSENAKVGNFVETKKAFLGRGSKASHLTYLGDCELGENVNIGAGTITCNYDGVNKHKTIIGDRVFVGSNTAIVAPAVLGEESVIAAGTTITKDVPPGALALSRAPQKIIEGWALKAGPVVRKRRKDANKN